MNNSTYTIKLYFAEIEQVNSQSRTFNVEIQGKKLLTDFNIANEANGINRLITKTFTNISIKDKLNVKLSSANTDILPLLSGIEIIATDIKSGAMR